MSYKIITKNVFRLEKETFVKTGKKQIVEKIKGLLLECEIHPKTGTGKPEQLKGTLSGFWSRRINLEHRLIYEIDEEKK